jgi:hypothetical protein
VLNPLPPLHTYCVLVTSDASSTLLLLLSIPASTEIPPLAQEAAGAVLRVAVITEFCPVVVLFVVVLLLPPPPQAVSNKRAARSPSRWNIVLLNFILLFSLNPDKPEQ